MRAPQDAQVRLLELQAVDAAIAQLQHRRTSLPEHVDIANSKTKRAHLTNDLVAAQTHVADLELAQAKAESDLEPVRARRERDRKRVADGSVTDGKQLSALLEEIEHLGRRIGALEDIELEVMEELEAAQTREAMLSAERRDLDTGLRALIARRDEQLGVLAADLAGRATQRAGVLQDLPTDLVTLYERIRTRGGGVGAAELRQGRCSGCQLQITNADLMRFRAAPADEVLRCEECDRILVRTSQSGL